VSDGNIRYFNYSCGAECLLSIIKYILIRNIFRFKCVTEGQLSRYTDRIILTSMLILMFNAFLNTSYNVCFLHRKESTSNYSPGMLKLFTAII